MRGATVAEPCTLTVLLPGSALLAEAPSWALCVDAAFAVARLSAGSSARGKGRLSELKSGVTASKVSTSEPRRPPLARAASTWMPVPWSRSSKLRASSALGRRGSCRRNQFWNAEACFSVRTRGVTLTCAASLALAPHTCRAARRTHPPTVGREASSAESLWNAP